MGDSRLVPGDVSKTSLLNRARRVFHFDRVFLMIVNKGNSRVVSLQTINYRPCLRPRQAFLVTKRDADFEVLKLKKLDTEVLKIPAHILSYLLGQSERLLWK